jgi:predicted nucleic acid-binding Zn finger protein
MKKEFATKQFWDLGGENCSIAQKYASCGYNLIVPKSWNICLYETALFIILSTTHFDYVIINSIDVQQIINLFASSVVHVRTGDAFSKTQDRQINCVLHLRFELKVIDVSSRYQLVTSCHMFTSLESRASRITRQACMQWGLQSRIDSMICL